MAVARRLGAKRARNEYLRRRRREKVVAAHDFRDARKQIVHHARERVTGAVAVAREGKVAKGSRHILRDQAGEDVLEVDDGAGLDAKAPAWQPGGRRPLATARGTLVRESLVPRGESPAADAGIAQLVAVVRSRLRGLDIAPRADARIDEIPQPLQRGPVDVATLRLDA